MVSGREHVAGARPPQAEARVARGDVLDCDRAVLRRVLADPGEVVPPERRAGDDAEAILRQPRHGEVALDPAPRVQHLRVGDRADLAGDVVVAEPLEQIRRALAGDLDLGERGLVEERSRLAAGAVLDADRRRPELARPPARAQPLLAARRVRLEPVRALPAGLLAERRTELLQARIGRREAQRPARLALVPRVLDVVVRGVDLGRAGERVGAAPVGGAEAARVHVPDVEARRPLDDPLRDELPHPAGAGEAVGAEARGDPEAAHVGRPEDELAVGRERLRPVDQPHDLHLLERRHPAEGVLEQRLEAGPVLLEQLAVEIRRDPVERPRRRVALVAADDEAARLGPEVDEERRVAHRRHLERQPARPGDEVLVRHRHDRDVHAGERAELPREHPARR